MRCWGLAVALCISWSLSALAQPAPDAVDTAIGEISAVVDFYPKPWPMRNLIKSGTLTVTVTGEAPPGDFVDPKTGELSGFVRCWCVEAAR